MTHPVVPEQDANEIRMPGEEYAQQVVYFAFLPVSRFPHAEDARHRRKLSGRVVLPPRQRNLQREAPAGETEARQVIDHFQMRLEPGLWGFLRVGFQVIDAGDVVEHLELQSRIVAE